MTSSPAILSARRIKGTFGASGWLSSHQRVDAYVYGIFISIMPRKETKVVAEKPTTASERS
jgi:hypothetical protein